MATPEEIERARARLGAPMAPPMGYAQQMAAGVQPQAPGTGALDVTLQGLAASQGGTLVMPEQTFVSPPPAAPLGPQPPPPGAPIPMGPRVSLAGPVRGPTPEAIQAARARLGGGSASQQYPAAAEALRGAYAEARDVASTPEPIRDARGELTKAYGTAMDAVVPEEEKARRAVDNAYGTARNAVRNLERESVGQRIRNDERGILGTFDTEAKAVKDAADAETAKALAASSRMEEMANLQAKKAQEEERIARDADAERTRYREQTDRLATELREKKIDPNRLYGDLGTGERIAFAIMGAIGGLYQASIRSQTNPFLDQLNKNIDRDIAAQVHDIDTKKASLAERSNIYAQMRAAHGDSALARAQVKGAMLDAAKMQLEAEAQRIGTPIAQARAEQQIAGIDRQAAELRRNIDVGEAQAAQRAAAANAAARAAAEEKAFQRGVTLQKMDDERRKVDLEFGDGANKPNGKNQTFVAVGKDDKGNAVGYHARDAETAKKRTEDLASGRALLKMYDQIINNREEEGKLGRATSRTEGGLLGTPKWKTDNAVVAKKIILTEKNIDKLGALSGSDMELESLGDVNALDAFGNTTTDRLRMRRKLIEDNLKLAEQGEAGARTRKLVGADGRPVFEPLDGPANAPNNPKTVQRNPLQK